MADGPIELDGEILGPILDTLITGSLEEETPTV
ncbi:hypothetical protein V525_13340 [Gordonia alkanivorans CGMCC 6845]|jgi:hypothetical protein|uniref:Uncharacterized protein n=1 Tax=Gordonia alkanivorans CGMCC 6845 TaxID=1423140 RepID=W9DJ04_9ACTN|nr:hypothetical protein GCWB2_13260 [Gordonia rubripertincta]ETA06551.1 hypothetical protein V525_13340 [Gordonia alkanivorans CGMCC 6845]